MRLLKKCAALLMMAACIATAVPTACYEAGNVNAAVVTPEAGLPTNTKTNKTSVWIQGSNNVARHYTIYYQKAKGFKKTSFIYKHGCACSALATVLSAYSPVYGNYTPTKVYQKLEKAVFGNKIWKKNYRKFWGAQRPLSFYGMCTILNAVGIPNTYVRTFTNAQAVQMITQHLYTGNPVVIEVNSRTQVDGVFSKKTSNKWALTKHTVVLLGITDTGKVIVADSSNRSWSGKMQRIKYTTVDEIVKYMIPTYVNDTSYYYTKKSGGGFILVNPQ